MTGLCRHTGKPIDNLKSALQGVEVIFTTRLFSRIMLRHFGAGVLEIIGKKLTVKLLPVFMQLVAVAIDRWEPRFKVRKVTPSASPEELRKGQLTLQIDADYRPKAHLSPPDYTLERRISFVLDMGQGGVKARL